MDLPSEVDVVWEPAWYGAWGEGEGEVGTEPATVGLYVVWGEVGNRLVACGGDDRGQVMEVVVERDDDDGSEVDGCAAVLDCLRRDRPPPRQAPPAGQGGRRPPHPLDPRPRTAACGRRRSSRQDPPPALRGRSSGTTSSLCSSPTGASGRSSRLRTALPLPQGRDASLKHSTRPLELLAVIRRGDAERAEAFDVDALPGRQSAEWSGDGGGGRADRRPLGDLRAQWAVAAAGDGHSTASVDAAVPGTGARDEAVCADPPPAFLLLPAEGGELGLLLSLAELWQVKEEGRAGAADGERVGWEKVVEGVGRQLQWSAVLVPPGVQPREGQEVDSVAQRAPAPAGLQRRLSTSSALDRLAMPLLVAVLRRTMRLVASAALRDVPSQSIVTIPPSPDLSEPPTSTVPTW